MNGHRLGFGKALAGLVVAALPSACGGVVDSSPATPGPTRDVAPPLTTPDTASASSATSAAPSVLEEGPCSARETALVVASDEEQTLGAFAAAGTWRSVGSFGAARSLTTFADAQGGLGVVYFGANGVYGVAETSAGASFAHLPTSACSGPTCFAPTTGAPFVSLSAEALVTTTLVGGRSQYTPAFFDSDAKHWFTTGAGVFPELVEGVAGAMAAGRVVLLYRGADGHLVDSILAPGGSAFEAPHHHDAIRLLNAAEVPLASIAAAASGDKVGAFYFAQENGTAALGGMTLDANGWSKSATTVFENGGPAHYVATGTSGGGFVVAAITIGARLELHAFTNGAFEPALVLGDTDLSTRGGLAIAPGICGDDAWLTYASATGEVRTRRVRGRSVSAPKVIGKLANMPRDGRIAIVTRAR